MDPTDPPKSISIYEEVKNTEIQIQNGEISPRSGSDHSGATSEADSDVGIHTGPYDERVLPELKRIEYSQESNVQAGADLVELQREVGGTVKRALPGNDDRNHKRRPVSEKNGSEVTGSDVCGGHVTWSDRCGGHVMGSDRRSDHAVWSDCGGDHMTGSDCGDDHVTGFDSGCGHVAGSSASDPFTAGQKEYSTGQYKTTDSSTAVIPFERGPIGTHQSEPLRDYSTAQLIPKSAYTASVVDSTNRRSQFPASAVTVALWRENKEIPLSTNSNRDDHERNEGHHRGTDPTPHVPPVFWPFGLKHLKLEELLMANRVWSSPADGLPPISSGCEAGMNGMDISNVTQFICRNIIDQHRCLSGFRVLSRGDREVLMRSRYRYAMAARFAINYNMKTAKTTVGYPGFSEFDCTPIKRVRNGYYSEMMSKYRNDESILVILCAIGLFEANGVSLADPGAVEDLQTMYYDLLKYYLRNTFSESEAALAFSFLTTWLSCLSLNVRAQGQGCLEVALDSDTCELLNMQIMWVQNLSFYPCNITSLPQAVILLMMEPTGPPKSISIYEEVKDTEIQVQNAEAIRSSGSDHSGATAEADSEVAVHIGAHDERVLQGLKRIEYCQGTKGQEGTNLVELQLEVGGTVKRALPGTDDRNHKRRLVSEKNGSEVTGSDGDGGHVTVSDYSSGHMTLSDYGGGHVTGSDYGGGHVTGSSTSGLFTTGQKGDQFGRRKASAAVFEGGPVGSPQSEPFHDYSTVELCMSKSASMEDADSMVNNTKRKSPVPTTAASAGTIAVWTGNKESSFSTDPSRNNNEINEEHHRGSDVDQALVPLVFQPVGLTYLQLEELLMANQVWSLPVDGLPPVSSGCEAGMNGVDITNVAQFICRNIINQHRCLSGFRMLSPDDREVLMKNRFYYATAARFAIKYNMKHAKTAVGYPGFPEFNGTPIRKIRNGAYRETMSKLRKSFPNRYRNNESILVILSAISLFDADDLLLTEPGAVEHQQTIYYDLLKRYLRNTFSESEAALAFSFLTTWLSCLSMYIRAQGPGCLNVALDSDTCELLNMQILW